MIIGGLQKFSLLDYPKHISAIIFTQGCNFRCHFCYNPELVVTAKQTDTNGKKGQSAISMAGLFDFLQSRRGKLDGAVITGGEPTLHSDLPEFIAKIKSLDYQVKLDTNGTNPRMLKELIKRRLVDYLAMDLKAQYNKYKNTVNAPINTEKIQQSAGIIMESGLPYEFRTTVVPGLHSEEDIEEMAKAIRGAKRWYLQSFKSDTNLLNREYEGKKSYSAKELKAFKKIAGKHVCKCEVR